MKTLTDKFNAFLKTVDSPEASQPVRAAKVEPKVRLYNIFKRSLPAGTNKLVFQNVTEDDINVLFRKCLRPITKTDQPVIYWDAVLVDSADSWNVYSNEGIGLTEGTNINTYRERKEEVEWKD